jgi:hypothetical protein
MGGLVARTFIKKYPNRWKHDVGPEKVTEGRRQARHARHAEFGSFAIPQVITGLEGLVRKLARSISVTDRHDLLKPSIHLSALTRCCPRRISDATSHQLYNPGPTANST